MRPESGDDGRLVTLTAIRLRVGVNPAEWVILIDLAVTGSGSGPQRVVFVHGVLDRGRSFEPVAALLENECRMQWYDRRGYGSSIDMDGVPADVDGHADDLVRVLNGEPAVVVGHSFGGLTVLGAALRAPGLVQAIVLYETTLAWAPGWDDTPMRTLLAGQDPEEAGIAMMFSDRYDSMSQDQRSRVRRQVRAFVAEERSIRTGHPPFDIAAITAPLIFGTSGTDRFTPVSDHLHDLLGDVETMVVPEGGHNAHRTAPEPFADLVRRGLARAAG